MQPIVQWCESPHMIDIVKNVYTKSTLLCVYNSRSGINITTLWYMMSNEMLHLVSLHMSAPHWVNTALRPWYVHQPPRVTTKTFDIQSTTPCSAHWIKYWVIMENSRDKEILWGDHGVSILPEIDFPGDLRVDISRITCVSSGWFNTHLLFSLLLSSSWDFLPPNPKTKKVSLTTPLFRTRIHLVV